MTKKRVYVSSTFIDLEKYRLRVKEVLERAGYDVEAMEKYPAFDQRPKDKCLEDVAQCDYYVLIVAHRYGYVPPADTRKKKSITELEYDEAIVKKKPVLAFLLNEDQPWAPKMMDANSLSAKSAIGAFRKHLQESHGVSFFTTEDNLATAVLEALRGEEEKEKLAVASSAAPQRSAPRTVVQQYNSTIKDLLQIRDAFHAQLCRKPNVIGTAVGRYLIRKSDPWPNQKRTAKSPPRTLLNSEVREYSKPCVLVFVYQWSTEIFDPAEVIDSVLTLPDGRSAPTCVVLANFEQPHAGSLVSYSSGPVGGGYPLIAEYQGIERVAAFGCLVKDEAALYALTSLRTVGREGQCVKTNIADRLEIVGKSSIKYIGTAPFSAVYPGLSDNDVNVDFDAGLVLVDNAKAVTAQIYGIGAPGPIAPGPAGISSLDLIGARVTSFGPVGGGLAGRIGALFYRYQTEDGSETICDFLIGPDGTSDDVSRLAMPGNDGTVWLLQDREDEDFPRPIACTVSRQRIHSEIASFTLAASLGTVTKLLDVRLVRDWNADLPTDWATRFHREPIVTNSDRRKSKTKSPASSTSRKRRSV